jgi:poly(3-hydroxybutyrate) depolymerase
MRRLASTILVLIVLGTAGFVAAQRPVEMSTTFEGKERDYVVFAPKKAPEPTPLVILFHGRGRSGMSILEPWRKLAKSERFILTAPASLHWDHWDPVNDGPRFLIHLIEEISSEHKIDTTRIYLFGHSAGANHALLMALLESERFAAVAVHAGALGQESLGPMTDAPRKIPFHIQIGTEDEYYPLEAVQATGDALVRRDFDVVVLEIEGHNHNYYKRSNDINETAWSFLKKNRLADLDDSSEAVEPESRK